MKKNLRIIVFLVLVLCISAITPLLAKEQWDITVDSDEFKSGYIEVYNDTKPPVPSTPVVINISSQDNIGKEFQLYLRDLDNIEVSGTLTGGTIVTNNQTATMMLPGTLKHGVYEIVLVVEQKEKAVEEIKVLNNVNLTSTISTDVVNYVGGTWDLVDGIQWAMYTPVNNKPTRETPANFIFDYGSELINISSLSVYSTYGNDQGPKTVTAEYWDNEKQDWIKMSYQGKSEYDLVWENNTECEGLEIKFDQEYLTNKVRFVVLDSYTSWENTNDLVELQVWGYQYSSLPSIELKQMQGTFGKENITAVKLKDGKESKKVKLELVDYNSKQKLVPSIEYQVDMVNGRLDYDFVIPDNVAKGEYAIHATSDTLDLYSDKYVIKLDQNKYFENSSRYFKATMLNGESSNLTKLIDGDLNTSCQIINQRNAQILFEVKPENNRYSSLVIKNMKIYADKDNIDKVILKSVANTNYYRNVNLSENGMINDLTDGNIEWKKDDEGDYFVLSPDYLSFGNIFILEIEAKDDSLISINEIETEAIYINDNVLNEAKIYHNDQEIDASEMLNNNVSSFYKTKYSADDSYVFDFSPRTIKTDELLYTAHFPKSQGIDTATVEYWDGNNWQKLDTYNFTYKTDNQIREVKQLVFDKVETTKLKLSVNKANTVWDDSYLFTNLNIIGELQTKAQYLADTLDTNIVVDQGTTKIPLPLLDDGQKDKYQVSIDTSSVPEIVNVNGDINPVDRRVEVDLVLKVSDKYSNDVGYTKPITVVIDKKVTTGNKLINPAIDTTTIYNNPAMGWVQYYEFQNTDVDKYWQEMDTLYSQGLKTNILYIRNPWSWYEPQEGVYAWQDSNSQLGKLIAGARKRGIQLAFRVLVDSSDAFQQATPEYVFDSGATWYPADKTDVTAPDIDAKDPYINDPVFLNKLEEFLQAFGRDFNNSLDVAFIDGMGFGNWGEVHHLRYHTNWDDNVNDAIEKVVSLYNTYFPDILLGAQEGQPENYGTNQSDELIINDQPYTGAFGKPYDFVVRRDTFGWMNNKVRQQLKDLFQQGIPIFAENCYHSFQVREYWYNNAGYPTLDGILKQVVSDALECRANTLDARVVMDCQSWLQNDQENGSKLLDTFALQGGYRLAPVSVEIPKIFETGKEISIHHSWRNYGVGVLPNNNSHWDKKYHVSFALLDAKTNDVVYQYNEATSNVNPGDWLLEDGNNSYDSKIVLPATLPSGEYKFAVGIVNHKNDDLPEIALAIQDTEVTKDNWYVLDTVHLSNQNTENNTYQIIIDPSDNGIVKASALKANQGENISLSFIPDDRYILKNVLINGTLVDVKNNEYVIKNVQSDQHVQATFIKATVTDVSKPATGDDQGKNIYLISALISMISLLFIIYNKKKYYRN